MTYTFDFTPSELHEIVTALHKNRTCIAARMRRAERRSQTPEEIQKQADDPLRKLYLDTIYQCRGGRIETIDRLLQQLEPAADTHGQEETNN